jgi:hypothetical protein
MGHSGRPGPRRRFPTKSQHLLARGVLGFRPIEGRFSFAVGNTAGSPASAAPAVSAPSDAGGEPVLGLGAPGALVGAVQVIVAGHCRQPLGAGGDQERRAGPPAIGRSRSISTWCDVDGRGFLRLLLTGRADRLVKTSDSVTRVPPTARQTGEKGGLLNRRKWDDKPLASVELHVRVRRATGIGFFSRHADHFLSNQVVKLVLISEVDTLIIRHLMLHVNRH